MRYSVKAGFGWELGTNSTGPESGMYSYVHSRLLLFMKIWTGKLGYHGEREISVHLLYYSVSCNDCSFSAKWYFK